MQTGNSTTQHAGVSSQVSGFLRRDSDHGRQWLSLVIAVVLTLSSIGVFVVWKLPRSWEYVLPLRLTTVGALVVAGIAAGASTVVFHTLTRNQILTPSLMGFDSIYILINTLIVFALGATTLSSMNPIVGFIINSAIMVVFALLVFSPMMLTQRITLDVLLLVGVVCGIFFKSLSGLLQRMIDPNEYQILQDSFFASFSGINRQLLVVTLVVTLGICIWLWRRRFVLDVMALGQPTAIGLGVNYRKQTLVFMAAITVMVAASTALVGPILFLGLIVAHLAYRTAGTTLHGWTIPIASFYGVAAMTWAQFILGQVFSYGTTVSVLIEFVGGILFLFLLMRRENLK